jgi:PAS domain S-box-containing protein
MSDHSLPDDSPVFRGLFDAYPDGVLVVDDRGRIVIANAAAAELLGYAATALEGLSVDALVPDSVAPRHAAYRQDYVLERKARPMGTDLDLMARRADGSQVMVEIALSPLRVDSRGTAGDYVVASVRGVGAYPRVKRAMQRAHYNEFLVRLGRVAVDTLNPDELLQRLPAAVRQALDVEAVSVMLLSPNQRELRMASYSGVHADEADRIVYPNRPDTAAGYVVAQRAPLIIADFEREQRFEVPARLLAAGAKCGSAVPLLDRGKVIGVLGAWSSQPDRFGNDEVAFLVALATLLSTCLQRAQAESQARHAQRLETVGQLTGGVAHDFNNLLTVIKGNLQLLEDQPAVRNDALSRQLVSAAARAGQRGADLTGKLLAFARRLALEPTPVDPVAILHSLADMLRRILGENIHVTLQTPPSCPRCLADAVQLESALLNVAVNARDAMADGGTLVLRCGTGAPPEIEGPHTDSGALDGDGDSDVGDAPHGWVWLSIEDNGSGMSEDVRDRAFEPFFTTKEVGRGTGLGLSTVYGFIKQSRGHVKLDSEPGAGTTVTIFLPALASDDDADVDGTQAALAAALPHGLHVLLVEDDAAVRSVAQAFLGSMDCEVVACVSAEAALIELDKAADGRAFDLLFSDIMLGAGIDGHELARRVNTQYPALAVLLTSGYSRHLADSGKSGAARRWPMLRKPYTRGDLTRAIAQCLLERKG